MPSTLHSNNVAFKRHRPNFNFIMIIMQRDIAYRDGHLLHKWCRPSVHSRSISNVASSPYTTVLWLYNKYTVVNISDQGIYVVKIYLLCIFFLYRASFSSDQDWPSDVHVPKVYDVQNTSTRLILLNNRYSKVIMYAGKTARAWLPSPTLGWAKCIIFQ